LSWGSAGALTGLLFIVLPVIVHLLGKDPAIRRHFPSLRFIAASRLLPTRWSRIHDPLLLFLRCAVVVFAVVALARPSRDRAPVANSADSRVSRVSRVVLLDTAGPGYRANPVAARAVAQAFTDSASVAVFVATSDPAGELQGATRRLAQERGRREIVVISDFSRSRYPAELPALIAPWAGLRFIRLPKTGNVSAGNPPAGFLWQPSPTSQSPSIELLAADRDAEFRDAVLHSVAAGSAIVPQRALVRVVVVLPGASDRDRLLRSARPLVTASVVRLAAKLQRQSFETPLDADGDRPLDGSMGRPAQLDGAVLPAGAIGVARRRDGAVALWALEDSSSSAPRLLLFSNLPARSPAVASVIAAITEVLAPQEAVVGDVTLPDSTLRRWERAPSEQSGSLASPVTGDAGALLARILWATVLLLLAAEWAVRRRIGLAVVLPQGHDADV